MKKVNQLAKKTKTNQKIVIETLLKTHVDKFSSLLRYETILAVDISTILKLDMVHLPTLKACAVKLIDMAFRKSAEPYDSEEGTYYKSLEKLESVNSKKLVEDRTITKKDVEALINPLKNKRFLGCNLEDSLPIDFDELTKMERKMDKGGLFAAQINEIRDKSIDLQSLVNKWKYEINPSKALEYYRHIKTIVKSETLEAYHNRLGTPEPFGRNMLQDIQKRLKQRYALDVAGKVPDCFYEDLIGMCGILTNECTLWWSKDFEL